LFPTQPRSAPTLFVKAKWSGPAPGPFFFRVLSRIWREKKFGTLGRFSKRPNLEPEALAMGNPGRSSQTDLQYLPLALSDSFNCVPALEGPIQYKQIQASTTKSNLVGQQRTTNHEQPRHYLRRKLAITRLKTGSLGPKLSVTLVNGLRRTRATCR